MSVEFSASGYAWDANGNRTQVHYSNALASGTSTLQRTYQTAAGTNRLQGYAQTLQRPGSAAQNSNVTFSYDAAGALVKKGDNHLHYGADGRIAKAGEYADAADARAVSYIYNALGQRVLKSDARGAGQPITVQTLYAEDGIGSTVLGQYANQRSANSAAPAGQSDSTEIIYLPTVKFDLRYPGQVSDEETGLSYNLHRYYDAATGRYIQADPIGLEGGWNRFAYVSNNPLNLIDPLGLSAADIDFMLKSLEREFDEFRPRGKWRFGLPSNFDDIAATEPISGDMIFRPEWSEPGCLSSEEFYTRIRKVFHEGMHSTDSILRRILGGDRNHNMIWNRGRWEFGDLHPSKRKKEGDIWGDPRGKPVDADKIYGNYLNHVPDCTCRR
jgi:RHS repeat-associated protein